MERFRGYGFDEENTLLEAGFESLETCTISPSFSLLHACGLRGEVSDFCSWHHGLPLPAVMNSYPCEAICPNKSFCLFALCMVLYHSNREATNSRAFSLAKLFLTDSWDTGCLSSYLSVFIITSCLLLTGTRESNSVRLCGLYLREWKSRPQSVEVTSKDIAGTLCWSKTWEVEETDSTSWR